MRVRALPKSERNPYAGKRYQVRRWGRGKSKGHAVFDTRSPKAPFPKAWVFVKKVDSESEANAIVKELEEKAKE